MAQKRAASFAAISEQRREQARARLVVLQPHLEEGAPLTRVAAEGGVPLRTASAPHSAEETPPFISEGHTKTRLNQIVKSALRRYEDKVWYLTKRLAPMSLYGLRPGLGRPRRARFQTMHESCVN